MTQPAKNYYTHEEYLRLEENSLEKHEYFQGEIYLMAGGTPRHNLIAANTITELNLKLEEKDCTTYSSDMRIMVKPDKTYTYADASVVCGELILAPDRNDTLVNPILIVEVLSPATEKYDRSQKFELYRGIKSFQYYLLIDQARVYVEYHQKIGLNKWVMETFSDLEQSLEIDPIGITLALASFYKKVKFDPTK
jgi:Uma2 family endonuclease